MTNFYFKRLLAIAEIINAGNVCVCVQVNFQDMIADSLFTVYDNE